MVCNVLLLRTKPVISACGLSAVSKETAQDEDRINTINTTLLWNLLT